MYKAQRIPEGYVVIHLNEQGQARLIDGATIHKHKQAAYRKAAQLNKKGEEMAKKPVEWVTREGHYISEVETRYIEDGKRTHAREAVNKFDEEGKERLLEKQLAGDSHTEEWDRMEEDPHMTKRTSSVVEERLKGR